ncbi:Para-hydroxybenzoate--polyprenyltransferase, mitochondrial precursor (PHB:polyprenyltransferase) [Cladochytrium tenue]|nr:Para-hydroxybenzoate--polyprenyltransferase, mitochondrial precursor (PHB:polyprenyltransferase) [Cladochytrium tenue]
MASLAPPSPSRVSLLSLRAHQTHLRSSASYTQGAKADGAVVQLPDTSPPLRMEPAEPAYWRRLPPAVLPYLRLARIDRPSGTHLLFLPCAWSISMATYAALAAAAGAPGAAATAVAAAAVAPPLVVAAALLDMGRNLALFYIGAFVMRGAGCTINDMWDRDIDGKALVFLGAQLTVGLAVLLQLNVYSILLGASSLGIVVVYPLMKRVTYWPQAVLGLAFNWGALLGWSAVAGVCNWSDRQDDLAAGVKSTALRFGAHVKLWLAGFAAASTVLLAAAGLANGHGPAFFAVAVGGAAWHYIRLIGGLRPDDRADAGRRFRQSRSLGLLVLCGVLLDVAWRVVVAASAPSAASTPVSTPVVAAAGGEQNNVGARRTAD